MTSMAIAAPIIEDEMRDWVALGGINLGIVGNDAHTSGFHRAANEISATDYSRRRDPNGADGPYVNWNYACAGDFSHDNDEALRALHRNVLARLMRGELSMICEFIGKPWADRPVFYWARWNGVTTLKLYTGHGHDRWSHISWYRSRVNQHAYLWRPTPPTPPITPPVQDWTKQLIMSLPTLSRGSSGSFVRRLQGLLISAGSTDSRVDGDFGVATERAVRREQEQSRIKVDGIAGPQTWTKLLGQ